MARNYSADDANLNTGSLITTRSKKYSDINLLFRAKTGSGDVYLSEDANAVKQSVKNLLLTNFHERPFNPQLGGGLREFLMDPNDRETEIEIRDSILRCIENFEPRAKIQKIRINRKRVSLEISLNILIINTQESVSLTLSIERLR